jgi:hypothetical protein
MPQETIAIPVYLDFSRAKALPHEAEALTVHDLLWKKAAKIRLKALFIGSPPKNPYFELTTSFS